jgi:tRNA 5-methylaminomethyl-2-thiouridine biosynthesis bifunctional protein
LPKQKKLSKSKNPFSKEKAKCHEGLYLFDQIGLEGRRLVYLDGNNLAERWNVKKDRSFTIGEIGFGAGLNFLITAKAWLKGCTGQTKTRTLNYISTEKSPLPKQELALILSQESELSELAEDLIKYYPPPISGIHRLYFKDKNIVLTLMYGDSYDMFSSIKNSEHPFFVRENNPIFDTWFIADFSKKNNLDLLSADLFRVIADLSQPGTTFSTFTKDNLIKKRFMEVGFSTNINTYSRSAIPYINGKLINWKSQSISKESWKPTLFNSPHKAPWYLTPKIEKPTAVVIIGGGIAGCSTARALAERGISVTMIERHKDLAQGASGNPQGILYPKLSSGVSEISRFGISSLIAASKFYKNFLDDKKSENLGDRCGVIILPKKSSDKDDFELIASIYPEEFVSLVSGKELDKKAGLSLSHRFGLFFPELGWINPPHVCRSLIEHPLICVKKAEVKNIELKKNLRSKEEFWVVMDDMENLLAETTVVVLACSFESKKFNQTNYLPLNKVRGQTTTVPANKKTADLKSILCGRSYFLPKFNGTHTLGATYNKNENEISNREEDHAENINQLNALDRSLSENFSQIDTSALGGRASFRCTTPDFLPIVGPAPKLNDYLKDYKLMKKNARSHIPIPGATWKGLYLNIGHGSKGLSYAPICADLIASQICKEVPPLELDLRLAIHPGRFIIRDIKRNKL